MNSYCFNQANFNIDVSILYLSSKQIFSYIGSRCVYKFLTFHFMCNLLIQYNNVCMVLLFGMTIIRFEKLSKEVHTIWGTHTKCNLKLLLPIMELRTRRIKMSHFNSSQYYIILYGIP